jgi:hypothetical protein
LVGGITTGNSFLSTIYYYNPDGDDWILLNERMKERKGLVIAMLVDREMFDIE